MLLSRDAATLPVWLCRVVPGAMMLGQAMSMIVGIYIHKDTAPRFSEKETIK